MSTEIIPPSRIVAEVAAILMRLACALETEPEHPKTLAAMAAEQELRLWMEPFEALALVASIAEGRIRCMQCSKAPLVSRARGPVCVDCAQRNRFAREARESDWETKQ